MSFLIEFLGQILAWLADFFVLLPKNIVSAVLTGLAAFLAWIPVPAFVSQASANIGALPPLVGYILSTVNFPAGLAIVLSAYVIRFLIRRIPFIG